MAQYCPRLQCDGAAVADLVIAVAGEMAPPPESLFDSVVAD